MKVPYILTSGAALCAPALLILAPSVTQTPRVADSYACDLMDDQFAMMPKLFAFVWLAAYIVFTAQGLRNRPGPSWLAIAGMLALSLSVKSYWWRLSNCVTSGSRFRSLLFAGIVSLMFLHHAMRGWAKEVPDRDPHALRDHAEQR